MQSVPNGKKRRLEAELAAREVDLAGAELVARRFDAGSAAADAWIGAATASESLDRLRKLRVDLEPQTLAARAALASGRAGLADVLTTETLLARLDDRIAMMEQELATRRAELSRWVADAGDRNFAALPVERELGGALQALVDDVDRHPPLAPGGARIEAARAEVELARAARRPDWSAEMTFAKRGPDYSDMVSLELRVALPLFSRHRQDPVIASKLARLRSREAEQQSDIRMHRAEIESMVASWRGGRTRLQQYGSQLLPLARDRSNAALASFRAGRGDLRSVSEALQDEIDVQIQYVELEAQVARAWAYLHLLHSGEPS
jgi:outer membrane protein TolC